MIGSTKSPINFPRQKIPTSKKTEDWYRDCVDSAESLIAWDRGFGMSKKAMQVCEDLYNNIFDTKELDRVFNPMGLRADTFPAAINNFPITIPKIDLLLGEEYKRRFDWSVRSMNDDAVSMAQKDIADLTLQLVEEMIASEYSEEQMQSRIEEFGKYVDYEYKDIFERMATHILKYLERQQNLKFERNGGFKNMLVKGGELYRIDDIGGEPSVKKVDPRNLYSLRNPNSYDIEDHDLLMEVTYEPIGQVIDEFYDYLTPKQIDRLEKFATGTLTDNTVLNNRSMNPTLVVGGPDNPFLDPNENYDFYAPFDEQGNIRVERVRWRGRRKMQVLTYFDPDTGIESEDLVSEYYKPDKDLGEKTRELWINEAYEATKLGKDILIKYGPREIQMRHLDNASKCHLGYVGTYVPQSLMERMRPYQYLYNVLMYRLQLIFARYQGPIMNFDVAAIPDGWEMDKWMYYAQILGFGFTNSFNEGTKGASTGKLVNTQGNTNTGVLNPNYGNYIQQLVLMLQYIEEQVGQIAGVTRQREGQISNRETVGGVERSVTQSSHITEPWFALHDDIQRRVYSVLLDTAIQSWKDKSKKLSYVLDDLSRKFMEVNGQDLVAAEFDIFITNSSEDSEIRSILKQLAHANVQNGGSMKLIIDVLRSDSIAAISKEIEYDQKQRIQREQKSQQEQIQAQREIAQAQIDNENTQKELDRRVDYAKIEADLIKAEMNQPEGSDNTLEKLKIQIQDLKNKMEYDFKHKELAEEIRHNKESEDIDRLKIKKTNTVKK